jgi:hypothetical protein
MEIRVNDLPLAGVSGDRSGPAGRAIHAAYHAGPWGMTAARGGGPRAIAFATDVERGAASISGAASGKENDGSHHPRHRRAAAAAGEFQRLAHAGLPVAPLLRVPRAGLVSATASPTWSGRFSTASGGGAVPKKQLSAEVRAELDAMRKIVGVMEPLDESQRLWVLALVAYQQGHEDLARRIIAPLVLERNHADQA